MSMQVHNRCPLISLDADSLHLEDGRDAVAGRSSCFSLLDAARIHVEVGWSKPSLRNALRLAALLTSI
jgi:hypothetical protein